jgi:hypothetical protein
MTCNFFFFILVGLGFELGALLLLRRRSTIRATPNRTYIQLFNPCSNKDCQLYPVETTELLSGSFCFACPVYHLITLSRQYNSLPA